MADERIETWKLTPFERWVRSEEIQVITTHTVFDVYNEPLSPWKRAGVDAALLDLTHYPVPGRTITNNTGIRYLAEIPPGGTFNAEKHMYEEIFYVAKGRGATTVWQEGGAKQTFEWHEDSVFAIPMNAWHEHYNASGTDPVRLYAATNMPTVFNLYDSEDFVFNCNTVFESRFSASDDGYFSANANRLGDRLMEANFIPSVTAMALDQWNYRGPSTNMHILMAGGRIICHLSEFPAGSYKKGHGFGTGDTVTPADGQANDTSYMFLSGNGYDLQWPPGAYPGPGVEAQRFDFQRGSLMSNGNGGHQHFNASNETARYLVFRQGNPAFSGRGMKAGQGSNQIEYEDEDPSVRAMFDAVCAERDVEVTLADAGD
jgi:mannose-6-phosphate isomerase-like protein (cupin superfamily)